MSLLNHIQTRTINDLDFDSDGEARELVSKLPPETLWESDLNLGILYNRLATCWQCVGNVLYDGARLCLLPAPGSPGG